MELRLRFAGSTTFSRDLVHKRAGVSYETVAESTTERRKFRRGWCGRSGSPSAVTHAITGAVIGAYGDSEQTLTRRLLGQLGPGMLCLADRGFAGFPLFAAAKASGEDLLRRARSNAVLPVLERYDDGSFRSEIVATDDKRTRTDVLAVRVIEYTITDPGRPDTAERYRLLTTIMDPAAAPAEELAPLYTERWEIETALDELKTHQRGPKVVLRSKTPDGVLQEIYGHLCTHYAIRALMTHAADEIDLDPDRVSFTRSLRAARRSTRAGLDSAPPPTTSPSRWSTPSSRSSTNYCPPDPCAPQPESSNARCPTTASNAPNTATGPDPPAAIEVLAPP